MTGPVHALAAQLAACREALEQAARIEFLTPAMHALLTAALAQPAPTPEQLAELERHAEIGLLVEAVEKEQTTGVELILKGGSWRCWGNNNSCPPYATPAEALRAALAPPEGGGEG